LLDNAVEQNTLDCLPDEIKHKYWLEDCIVEYEITEERINELKDYVFSTVNEIESKDASNEAEWKPVEINKYNSFYCSVLCGHRRTCKFYKEFFEKSSNQFKKKNKVDVFDNLFS
ncbi:hypothetical protein P8888_19295, partial [Bacillus haynesii]|nr:hypothetical protein [Bacillus haynesii]